MIKPFKSGVAEDAFLSTSSACLLVEILALFWNIEEFVGWSSEVKRFVSVDTVIPVVILTEILAILGFVSVKVEKGRINGLQVVLQLLGCWLLFYPGHV
jgi:hypothetical protein